MWLWYARCGICTFFFLLYSILFVSFVLYRQARCSVVFVSLFLHHVIQKESEVSGHPLGVLDFGSCIKRSIFELDLEDSENVLVAIIVTVVVLSQHRYVNRVGKDHDPSLLEGMQDFRIVVVGKVLYGG